MDIVTKFETAPPQKGDFGSYEEVLFALRYESGVAENVYAKRAKHDLRNAIELPVVMMKRDEVKPNLLPVWVDQHTVVLSEEDFPTAKPEAGSTSKAGDMLQQTTERLLSSIATTLKGVDKGAKIVMIDPLWTRIQQVARGVYSFSLKQRWAVTYE